MGRPSASFINSHTRVPLFLQGNPHGCNGGWEGGGEKNELVCSLQSTTLTHMYINMHIYNNSTYHSPAHTNTHNIKQQHTQHGCTHAAHHTFSVARIK